MIVTLALWAAAALLALLAVSALAQLARARGWREAALWDAPLAFTAATLALLAVLGVFPPLGGAVLAVTPLAAAAATMVPSWRALASRDGKGRATWRVLAAFGGHVRDSALNSADDLRGLLRRDHQEAEAAPEGGGYRPVPGGRPRMVPSLLKDAALGPPPHPASVAADLERQGVAVPGTWGALAESEASFEAEDEDDLLHRKAERAAGVLTWAEALQAQAENLAVGNGLDPDVIAAEFEFADLAADLAAAAVMTARRYHGRYEGIHEHRDAGGTLPRNADGWFGAQANPEGGYAA